jgi:hypothetical protein
MNVLYVEIKCIILPILKQDGFFCSLVCAESFSILKRPIVPSEQKVVWAPDWSGNVANEKNHCPFLQPNLIG